MIIGYIEDGEVQIYRDLDEALAEWGPYPADIISDVVIFYTLEGKYLEPTPIYSKRKWFQLEPKIVDVTFEERDPKEGQEDEIGYLVHSEALRLKNNLYIDSIEELKELVPWES